LRKLRIFAALSVASTFALLPLITATPAYATCINTTQAATIAAAIEPTAVGETPTVTTLETCGGDDVSYQVPITTTVTFDGVQYSSVYATTNSVITFGAPDGTYWTYPSTPSISLYSMDWVVYPSWRSDEHLIIQSSDGGFQVDISARPIWLQNTQTPTNIVITAAINVDGTVAMSYLVTGPTYDEQTRTGVRLTNGNVVTLAEYGVTQVETAPVLSAVPVETTTATAPSDSQTAVVDTPTATSPFIPQGAVVISEGSTASVTAPTGKRVLTVSGYYGDPNNSFRGLDVSSTLTSMFAGNTSFTVTSSNQFGDPAPGTVKVLIFLVTYEDIPQPIPSDTSTSTVDSGSATVDTQTSQTDTSTAPGPQPVVPTPPAPVEPAPVIQPLPPVTEPDPVVEPEQQPTPEPEPVPEPEEEPAPAPAPEPEPIPEVAPEPPSVENVVDDAMADGTLTEAEKEIIAEVLIADALANGVAVTAEDLKDAGLTYADLPAETPVKVRTDEKGNEVIITAEVANALTLVENPAELIGAIFTDPATALLALGSLGADMSDEEREESTKAVVATVIAGGAAIQAAAVAASTTTGSTSTGGSSGGNNNAARRRETL
jgi:hypothetical protein